jgi:hypothetical protein
VVVEGDLKPSSALASLAYFNPFPLWLSKSTCQWRFGIEQGRARRSPDNSDNSGNPTQGRARHISRELPRDTAAARHGCELLRDTAASQLLRATAITATPVLRYCRIVLNKPRRMFCRLSSIPFWSPIPSANEGCGAGREMREQIEGIDPKMQGIQP